MWTASDGCVTVTLCLFSRCLTVVEDKLSSWRGLRMGSDTTGWFIYFFSVGRRTKKNALT